MDKFKLIPCVYAGDIPYNIHDELIALDETGICLHGDDGSVKSFHRNALDRVPNFVRWMVEIGAWTESEIDLPCYRNFCASRNLNSTGEPYHYQEYYDWLQGRSEYLVVAFTGT